MVQPTVESEICSRKDKNQFIVNFRHQMFLKFQLAQFKLLDLIKEVDSVPGAIVKTVAEGQQRQNILRFRAQERRERRVRSCRKKINLKLILALTKFASLN